MGMSVTNERIHNLNNYTSTTAAVTITDNYSGDEPAGTTVVIEIRIKTIL